ncbi:DNA-directed RNA polymerase subunit E'' [Candidatus Woesearchaeota archaeon CG10_big_fil_rev_8_21_14_0_10_32_9]|nr:MAG: DNA-directed RNA polymerase subunit E'' [Candidatus Woesearchaeota archaeon CG10_big_fil_rev_8_21_14_0_10_32_9]
MAVKREVCRKTKKFLDDPNFKEHKPASGTTTNWQGRIYVVNPEKSAIAKIMGLEEKGEYAIKVR